MNIINIGTILLIGILISIVIIIFKTAIRNIFEQIINFLGIKID